MPNRVTVWKYFYGLTIETKNLAFEVKVILGSSGLIDLLIEVSISYNSNFFPGLLFSKV